MRYRSLLRLLCLCAGLMSAVAASVSAAPSLRYQTDLHGDMVVIGNTLGFDCRAGIPDPTVGTFDRTQCYLSPVFNTPGYIDDRSADVFWRCEDTGQVSANPNITMAQARSAAILQLPAGATVAYARVYWGSTVREDITNVSSITIDRPGSGSFSQTVMAASSDIQAADRSFQATADITGLVQAQGPGIYRVAGAMGFPKNQLVDRMDDNNYAAWAIVVVYKLDSAPVRNFAVYDGLTFISPNSNSTLMASGFVVPAQGAADGKLAVLGYKGDHDLTGDALLFNGTALTDGQPGSDSNFFNSSHTFNGQPVSVTGDLPQLNGQQGSMSGMDLDVVSIGSMLNPNDTQARIDMTTGTTVGSDMYFVGALATAIGSTKPVINATLTVPAETNPLPGDTVQYTLTITNVGSDTAKNVSVQHALPAELNYVAGSLRVVSGPNQGQKTDMPGDDELDYDPNARMLTLRLGTGANATMGGTISANAPAIVVTYQLQVADSAFGQVATQATVLATPSGQPGAGATPYLTSDGTLPNHPTVISVRECASNYDCTVTSPVCDLLSSPHRCTASCSSDMTCVGAPGGNYVCGAGMTCTQCSPSELSACSANGLGAVCLPTGACGCNSDADCGGRPCNTSTNTCPKPSADLSPTLTIDPNPADVAHPVNIAIAVENSGPAGAPSGAEVLFQLQNGGSITAVQGTQGWRCAQVETGISCTYYEPLAAGATSPTFTITVTPASASSNSSGTTTSLTVQATVSSNSSTDPNPQNDSMTQTIPLGSYQVAGGGFGCTLAPARHTASMWSAAAVALFALLSLRRGSAGTRRRRTARASKA